MNWLKDLFLEEVEKKPKKSKPKKEKSLLDDEQFSELGPYEDDEEKWINIEITIMAPYTELIKLKTTLKPYAEELDWEIESGSHTLVEDNTKVGGSKTKRVNITLRPNGDSISPIEFLNNKDKINGLVFAIHRDILYGGNHEEAVKEFNQTININSTIRQGHSPNKRDYAMSESVSFLSYDYKLNDRIKFEKRNKKLALKLFGNTVEEDLKSIFKPEEKKDKKLKKTPQSKKTLSKEEKELLDEAKDLDKSNKKFKKKLEEVFGFKL